MPWAILPALELACSSTGLGRCSLSVSQEPGILYPVTPQPLPNQCPGSFSLHCHGLAKPRRGEHSYGLASRGSKRASLLATAQHRQTLLSADVKHKMLFCVSVWFSVANGNSLWLQCRHSEPWNIFLTKVLKSRKNTALCSTLSYFLFRHKGREELEMAYCVTSTDGLGVSGKKTGGHRKGVSTTPLILASFVALDRSLFLPRMSSCSYT